MDFPAGRTILLIAMLAAIGIIAMQVSRERERSADQVVWVFDPSHRDTYALPSDGQASLVNLHQASTGLSTKIELMPARALDARLLSLILSDTRDKAVPDLVEIEIGSVGKYFRVPADHGGLLPLDGFIAADPAARSLSPARLAIWTHDGKVLGIPRDVHPVSITYRNDLFAEAGVDLAACTSWRQLHEACLRYQHYFTQKSQERWAFQLARWHASDLMILLYQQRISLADTDGRPVLTDPRIAETLAFYASLVAGSGAISAPVSASVSTQDLADGHTAALFTPDWRVEYLRTDPSLAGKLRMMPLPRFADSDAPTASWGGTMVAIPRNARDPAASWQLLHDLQLTPEAMRAREAHSSILPANASAWNQAAYQRPDPFFGGQPIGQLYVQLARQLPQQRVSPYAALVSQSLATVLSEAQSYLQAHGEGGLVAYCQTRLSIAQQQLQKLLDFAETPS